MNEYLKDGEQWSDETEQELSDRKGKNEDDQ